MSKKTTPPPARRKAPSALRPALLARRFGLKAPAGFLTRCNYFGGRGRKA